MLNNMKAKSPRPLRVHRAEQGLTQVELSRKSGVHAVSISRFESGHTALTVRNIQRLAAALGVEVSEIVLSPNDSTLGTPSQISGAA